MQYFIAGNHEQFRYWRDKLGIPPKDAKYIDDIIDLYRVRDGTIVMMVGLWAQSPVLRRNRDAFNHLVHMGRIKLKYIPEEFEPVDVQVVEGHSGRPLCALVLPADEWEFLRTHTNCWGRSAKELTELEHKRAYENEWPPEEEINDIF